MAKANLFNSAKPVGKPAVASKATPSLSNRVVEGLEAFSTVKALGKLIKGLEDTLKTRVKQQGFDWLVEEGIRVGKAPENIKGKEGIATVTLVMGKRSTASALDENQVELFKKLSIPYTEVSDVVETFIFNPAHLQWLMDNADKVSAALQKVPGCPDDVIQQQVATKKFVVTDETLDAVFKIKSADGSPDEELIKVVADVASVVSVKDKLAQTDVPTIFKAVQDVILESMKEQAVDVSDALKEQLAASVKAAGLTAGAK